MLILYNHYPGGDQHNCGNFTLITSIDNLSETPYEKVDECREAELTGGIIDQRLIKED